MKKMRLLEARDVVTREPLPRGERNQGCGDTSVEHMIRRILCSARRMRVK
jgi:hypothetical protein